MASTQEITLPWKPTVDGAFAELGAVFRVELVGGDWQCAVKSGRCRTVIAKGLKTQAAAKRRAEAHAATMPEVRAAAADDAADAKPGAKKVAASRRSKKPEAKSQKPEPTPAPEPAPAAAPVSSPTTMTAGSGITFQRTDDGCLCGKTQGVCWVANADDVVLSRPLPQPVIDQIRAAVADHYATVKTVSEAAPPEAAPRRGRKVAARARTRRPAPERKAATAKKAAKKVSKPPPKPSRTQTPAKQPTASEAKGRKTGRGRASKKTAKAGRKDKEDAPVDTTTPPAAKRQRKPEAPPAAAAPTGPITWSDVEGKPRGVAAHGTFVIEPEGQAFGLYFADAGGQSRHLRSGTMPDLRRAAEEFAARGEPPPLRDAPSREQDEALMRIFASGAVEGA